MGIKKAQCNFDTNSASRVAQMENRVQLLVAILLPTCTNKERKREKDRERERDFINFILFTQVHLFSRIGE